MPDVLVFGATGYTGQLTARALSARGADFIVAGRDRAKLEDVARTTGASGVAIAEVGDATALADAATRARVLLSCVGPFTSLGHTAADAAITAGVNYLDSAGEGAFIADLIDRCDADARRAHIAMAPALGLDEVPADVAATLATEGFDDADLVLTYALSITPSRGTMRSALGIASTQGRWIEDGRFQSVPVASKQRWAPLPAPLGPSRGISFPFAEEYLAPLHLDLRSLQLFVVTSGAGRVGLQILVASLREGGPIAAITQLVDAVLARAPAGPAEGGRTGAAWTILAEASCGGKRRTVAVSGRDAYGLTAELLATAAMEMAAPGYNATGVLAPVEAIPIARWRQELARNDVSIELFESL